MKDTGWVLVKCPLSEWQLLTDGVFEIRKKEGSADLLDLLQSGAVKVGLRPEDQPDVCECGRLPELVFRRETGNVRVECDCGRAGPWEHDNETSLRKWSNQVER